MNIFIYGKLLVDILRTIDILIYDRNPHLLTSLLLSDLHILTFWPVLAKGNKQGSAVIWNDPSWKLCRWDRRFTKFFKQRPIRSSLYSFSSFPRLLQTVKYKSFTSARAAFSPRQMDLCMGKFIHCKSKWSERLRFQSKVVCVVVLLT